MGADILLVTGMVRSGTTLISRAIDAHPELVCALDPCMGVVRSYNNAVLRDEYGSDVDPDAPLTDFFFEDRPPITFYETADMHVDVREPLPELRQRIASFAELNSPAILGGLDSVSGDTYAEVLESLLEVIAETYGNGSHACVGFKQTWIEAFVAPLLETFDNARCVHVVRDPRAVIASWKKSTHLSHDYPFLMMIRHWRKSVALAARWGRRYPGRHLLLRYEEFVRDPTDQLARVAELCGVDYDERMQDVDIYQDGEGRPWRSNTSYGSKGKTLTSAFTDRWRERLSEPELRLIEELCAPEMEWLGLERATEPDGFDPLIRPDGPEREPQAAESKPFTGYRMSPENRAKELARWLLFRHAEDHAEFVASGDALSIVLDPALVRSRAAGGDRP